MFRPVIFGVGAALAGCLLNAIVLSMGVQIGIVALAVGWMVGKAIRHGSYGIGGRKQQVLAVALTYLAISMSVLPLVMFRAAKHVAETRRSNQGNPAATALPAPSRAAAVQPAAPKRSLGAALVAVIATCAISPFLILARSPVGGLISLFILFIGLQRAWAMTARHDIPVTGPYPASPVST